MVRFSWPSTCNRTKLYTFLPLIKQFLRGRPFLLPLGGNRNAKTPVVKGLIQLCVYALVPFGPRGETPIITVE